jgi:hypothetical protein
VADLLDKKAVIVFRIGGKKLTVDDLANGLLGTLRAAIPTAELVFGPVVSDLDKRQTRSFQPGTVGCGFEADFVFRT